MITSSADMLDRRFTNVWKLASLLPSFMTLILLSTIFYIFAGLLRFIFIIQVNDTTKFLTATNFRRINILVECHDSFSII